MKDIGILDQPLNLEQLEEKGEVSTNITGNTMCVLCALTKDKVFVPRSLTVFRPKTLAMIFKSGLVILDALLDTDFLEIAKPPPSQMSDAFRYLKLGTQNH